MTENAFNTLRPLTVNGRKLGDYHSLSALEAAGLGRISRLPVSLRMVLESLVRNVDGRVVTEQHVRELAAWQPNAVRTEEIPFVVARIIAPDSSGIPFLADLAAMRDAAKRKGYSPTAIEPSAAVDLVVDHSLQVEQAGRPDGLLYNMREEYRRNEERYVFLKWAASAFKGFTIVPPGSGIIHQINIERLGRGVVQKDGMLYPDTLVGTDSHTPMINGLGVLGWGVGGIEATAAMLGQPMYFLTPDVVGVELKGSLAAGVTTTDMALTITERLRRAKVVGKFVEFFGDGTAGLVATDRCTISNMAPEYGATAALFPIDDNTLAYMKGVGRPAEQIEAVKAYFEAQGMFGTPVSGQIDYTEVVTIDLSAIVPSVAGPSRPQDRISLDVLKPRFNTLMDQPVAQGGFGKAGAAREAKTAAAGTTQPMRHGDIVLAAITSCTNTSNPSVLIAAGLLAKKAVEKGLKTNPRVKTSFTPGSRVVNAYLTEAGLQPYLDKLGFNIVGYACATCMGNSGPLAAEIESEIRDNELVVAAVLSGNRNFEARIHPAIRSNFLMSPPLVVAFAIAGRIDFDTETEPLGHDAAGAPVFLRDVWPTSEEVQALMKHSRDPAHFTRLYSNFTDGDDLWRSLKVPEGATFEWNNKSTYMRRPPFFDDFEETPPALPPLRGARALAILGDSVTTDHVSPGSDIAVTSPAGIYLREHAVTRGDFNSYIARRTNHEIMVRGTFASTRLRNLMLPGSEGGVTVHQPDQKEQTIFEAAETYAQEKVPLVVIAGEEYGTGSSRDWAAKGPNLLGVRAVIARGFERIHRSNLVGMGILPCQFIGDDSAKTLGLDGTETYEIAGIENGVEPRQEVRLIITRKDGSTVERNVLARVDSPIESDYFRHGGIMPLLLRKILEGERAAV